MKYLFGIGDTVSIVMNERYLTEEEQSQATIVMEELPVAEKREGFYSVMYIDPITKEFSYKYKPNVVLDKRQRLLDLVYDGIITEAEMDSLLNN